MDNTVRELFSATRRVRKLLEEFPETRNNDKLLLYYYWVIYDGINNFDSDFIEKATSPETITRIRRKFQSQGLYLPTTNVSAKRAKRRSLFEAYFQSS